MEYENRFCNLCNKEYKPKQPNQKFCGYQCRDQAQYEKYKVKSGMKISNNSIYRYCPFCNKKFQIKKLNKNDIFCSGACKLKYDNLDKEDKDLLSPSPDYTNYISDNEKIWNKIKSDVKYNEKQPYLIFQNEEQFMEWFKIHFFLFGIKRLLKADRWFPDIIAELNNEKVVSIELEYYSTNFARHQHTPYYCDLIISYLKPPYQDKVNGIPVLAIYTAKDFQANGDFDYKSVEYTEFFKSIIDISQNNLFSFLQNNKNIWR